MWIDKLSHTALCIVLANTEEPTMVFGVNVPHSESSITVCMLCALSIDRCYCICGIVCNESADCFICCTFWRIWTTGAQESLSSYGLVLDNAAKESLYSPPNLRQSPLCKFVLKHNEIIDSIPSAKAHTHTHTPGAGQSKYSTNLRSKAMTRTATATTATIKIMMNEQLISQSIYITGFSI